MAGLEDILTDVAVMKQLLAKPFNAADYELYKSRVDKLNLGDKREDAVKRLVQTMEL